MGAKKEKRKILFDKVNYSEISLKKAIELAKKIGVQSECNGDKKKVEINFDFNNNIIERR